MNRCLVCLVNPRVICRECGYHWCRQCAATTDWSRQDFSHKFCGNGWNCPEGGKVITFGYSDPVILKKV